MQGGYLFYFPDRKELQKTKRLHGVIPLESAKIETELPPSMADSHRREGEWAPAPPRPGLGLGLRALRAVLCCPWGRSEDLPVAGPGWLLRPASPPPTFNHLALAVPPRLPHQPAPAPLPLPLPPPCRLHHHHHPPLHPRLLLRSPLLRAVRPQPGGADGLDQRHVAGKHRAARLGGWVAGWLGRWCVCVS